jgi:4-hydroxy-tetrahydrodipicolinate synthase
MQLTGLWVNNVSFFDRKGHLDRQAVGEHAAFLAAAGVVRIVPAGNTGEFASLDTTESLALLRATRDAVPEGVVVLGVGGALPVVNAVTREALANGADGVMLHEPSHTHISRTGLERYFREIGNAAEGRVLLYKRHHDRLPDDIAVELVREGLAWGVKYGVNDLVAFQRARESAPEGLWICGTAEMWAPLFHPLGANGFTSGLANAAPGLALAMESAFRTNDLNSLFELRSLVRPFEELRAEDDAAKNVPAVRTALEFAGFQSGHPRLPLTPLEPADVRRVSEIWDTWTAAGFAPSTTDSLAGRRAVGQ